jgi:hypothetical protein
VAGGIAHLLVESVLKDLLDNKYGAMLAQSLPKQENVRILLVVILPITSTFHLLFAFLYRFLDLLGYISILLWGDLLLTRGLFGGLPGLRAERRCVLVSEWPLRVGLRRLCGAHTRHLAELSLAMRSGDVR